MPAQAEPAAGQRRPPINISRPVCPASGTRGSIRCIRTSTGPDGSRGPGAWMAVLWAPDSNADRQHAEIVKGKPEGDRDRCSDPDSPQRRLLQEAWAERRAVRPRAVTVVRRLRRPRHLPRRLRFPTRPHQPEPIHQCLPLRRAWIHATPGGGRATLTAWPLRRLRPARVGPRAKRRPLGQRSATRSPRTSSRGGSAARSSTRSTP